MSNLKSFSGARKAFQANFAALLKQFSYTATTFSMRLNQSAFAGGSTKHVVSAEDVDAWISGTKIPSLYAIYKVTDFFNITIDSLLSSEPIATNLVAGKSFAKQTASSPKVINITPTTGATTMAVKKTTTTNTNAKMRELIKTRTTSTDYNLNLAYRILNSDMQLKDIATKTGVSTRSLRDYAYYGTSIDADVAKQLASVLRTNTTSLGLKLNKETMRYESVK